MKKEEKIQLTNLEANALDHITRYNHTDCWFILIEDNQVYDNEEDKIIDTKAALIDLHDSIFLEDVQAQLEPEEQEALLNLYKRIGHPIEEF